MERTHVGASGTEWDLSLVERVLIAGRALWFYAGKLLWPWPLVFFYPRWTIDPHVAWQYLYPAAALIVLAALWWKRARLGRGPLAAVLIFAGVLLPALGFFNVYPFRFSFVADHFQYHASIALISLAAAAATLALAKAPHNARRLAPWAVAIVLLPLAGVARQRAGVYRDLTTLFADTIAQNPAAWAAHHNLGIVLYTQGRNDEAIEQFRRAIAINPGDARLRNSLGGALFVRGALPEAAAELSRALEGNLNDHDRAEAHVHLANVLVSQGHFELGLGHYRQGIALRPDYFDGLYNYAVALRMHGQPEAAAEQVRAALALQPQAAPAYHELGAAYLAQGKIAEAIGQLQRAVRLQPMNSRFHDDLGLALLRSGDARAAEKTLRRGLVLNPLSANAHTLLGEALAAQGDASGASEQFQSALQIDPRHAAAAANLEQLQPAGRRRVSPDQ
ncbi:MAG TPA: tetratricopeptide repeat protein [Pirellulales bacterium]|nr:tetratricopeptide repeat protein [Pirellulales bacterium]